MIRRLLPILMLAACSLVAQEHGEAAEHGQAAAHESGDPALKYKLLNFAILAAGLGYLAVKFGGPALRTQQQEILDGLNFAARKAEEAAARAREIEKQVAGLQTEVGAIRDKAQQELQAESQRIQAETAQMLAKVEHSAEQEIAAAAKYAKHELKAEAARIALDLAVQKIRARVDPNTQAALVNRFVQKLASAAPEQRN